MTRSSSRTAPTGCAPPSVPGWQTRSQRFDGLVLEALAPIDRRWHDRIGGLDIAVDDVPPVREVDAERTTWPPEVVGDATNFLLENQDAIVATNEGRVLYIELPASVELTVEYTEPGLQGDRSTGGTKPAKLETGHSINVPLFIVTGEKIKVDTRDGSYISRVS